MPAGRIILKSISQSRKLALLKTDGARLLYTWLITHLDINGCFSGDPEIINGQIFTRLKKSIKKVEEYLIDLEAAGLIIRYQANGDVFLNVPDFQEKQPNLNPEREAKSDIPAPSPDQLKTNSRETPDELKKNSPLSKVKQSKVKQSKEEVSSIISYLNEKAGKNFSDKSDNTVHLISGRLSEGRTVDDFKKVIDIKVAQWKGDPKMDGFLRPDTLFRPSNFESYLNEKVIARIDDIQEWVKKTKADQLARGELDD